MSEVVIEVIALILQGVKGFVFDVPTGTAATRDNGNGLRVHGQIGDPTEVTNRAFWVNLPVIDHRDQDVDIRLVQGGAFEPAIMMEQTVVVLQGQNRSCACFEGGLHLREQKGVAARFDADDETRVRSVKVRQVRRVGAQGVLHHDDRQVRMLAAKVLEKTSGGVAFAIVLGVAVLFDNRFGTKGDNFAVVRMDQSTAQHLMGIGDLSVAAFLFQAARAVDFFGGEIGSAVETQQVATFEKRERFEDFAALELAKDTGESGPQLLRRDVIENDAHLGVARDALKLEDSLEIELVVMPLLLEGQQRRGLEREQSDSGHEGVGQRDFRLGTKIRNLREFGTKQAI